MFKLVSKPVFKHKVEVLVPEDGGHRSDDFTAHFALIGIAEASAFDLNTLEGQEDFLKAVLTGADDLVDGTGKPLPWSDKVRDALIDDFAVRTALIRCYDKAVTAAARKN